MNNIYLALLNFPGLAYASIGPPVPFKFLKRVEREREKRAKSQMLVWYSKRVRYKDSEMRTPRTLNFLNKQLRVDKAISPPSFSFSTYRTDSPLIYVRLRWLEPFKKKWAAEVQPQSSSLWVSPYSFSAVFWFMSYPWPKWRTQWHFARDPAANFKGTTMLSLA